MSREFDIVVFGATGFTGWHCMKLLKTKANVKWAAAGRSEQKLCDALRKSECPASTPLIEADVFDTASLNRMCQRARVLINCVGPYRDYGEPVVAACVANGCDYVDITGEPEFIFRVMHKYNDAAKQAGVMIVPACGFDSVPSDIGVQHLKHELLAKGLVPVAMEAIIQIHSGPSGISVNIGTFESMIKGMADRSLTHKPPRIMNTPFPKFLRLKPWPRYDKRTQAWLIPFVGVDPAITRVSQEYLATNQKDVPPVQFLAYLGFSSLFQLVGALMGVLVLGILSQFAWGRWLLLTYPRQCTLGYFSREGPTPQQIKETSFTTTFFTYCYSKTEDWRSGLRGPDVVKKGLVCGPEMAYVTTPICAVNCAMVLHEQKLPCGVLTSASAFAKSDLVERLRVDGLSMSLV